VGSVLTVGGSLILLLPQIVSGVKAVIFVFSGLRLATIEYTIIALAGIVAIYGIINLVRSLKGEAYVGTSIKETIFGQIKQDIQSLMGAMGELLPALEITKDTIADIPPVVKAASLEIDKLGESYGKATLIMGHFKDMQELVLHNLQSVLGFGGVSPSVLAGQRYQYATEQEFQEALAGMGNIYTGTGWITPEHSPEQYQHALETYGTPEESIKGYQHGGLVENTGLAYLHAGEAVIPANESMGGGIVVNFTQPVFFDREDTMNRFVDMISKGIDRKYRLNGRSLA